MLLSNTADSKIELTNKAYLKDHSTGLYGFCLQHYHIQIHMHMHLCLPSLQSIFLDDSELGKLDDLSIWSLSVMMELLGLYVKQVCVSVQMLHIPYFWFNGFNYELYFWTNPYNNRAIFSKFSNINLEKFYWQRDFRTLSECRNIHCLESMFAKLNKQWNLFLSNFLYPSIQDNLSVSYFRVRKFAYFQLGPLKRASFFNLFTYSETI